MYAAERNPAPKAPQKALFERSEKTWKNVGKCRKKVGGLLGIIAEKRWLFVYVHPNILEVSIIIFSSSIASQSPKMLNLCQTTIHLPSAYRICLGY